MDRIFAGLDPELLRTNTPDVINTMVRLGRPCCCNSAPPAVQPRACPSSPAQRRHSPAWPLPWSLADPSLLLHPPPAALQMDTIRRHGVHLKGVVSTVVVSTSVHAHAMHHGSLCWLGSKPPALRSCA